MCITGPVISDDFVNPPKRGFERPDLGLGVRGNERNPLLGEATGCPVRLGKGILKKLILFRLAVTSRPCLSTSQVLIGSLNRPALKIV